MKDVKKLKLKSSKKQVCLPDAHLNNVTHTPKEFKGAAKSRLKTITKEFADGFEFLGSYPKSVSFFGSARFKSNNFHYKQARRIAARVCEEGYAVVTGGGPGIMEAANRGAKETCGSSIGFNIELPFEQNVNPYVTHGLNFYYFFSRKVILSFSAEAYLFFPGGFGTLDEFFEIVTLVQTQKITRVPIVCVGKDFWEPVLKLIEKDLFRKHKTIHKKDMNLFKITDDEDEIMKIVHNAPMRDE